MRNLAEISTGLQIAVNPYNEYYCAGRHTHDFIEIKYIISGKGKHIINGYEFDVSSGDVFVVNPGSSHYFKTSKENPILAFNLNVDMKIINSTLSDEKLGTLPADILSKPFTVLHDEQQYLKNILEGMHSECINKDIGYMEQLYADFLRIMVYIGRYNSNAKTEDVNKNSRDPIFNVVSYLDEHYTEDITLDRLSEISNYNSSYLSRRFKQVVGVGISEYIHKIRVNRACIYLRESNKSFMEIAFTVGYENENYFRRVFKRIVGKNPQDYKKALRENAYLGEQE